MAQYTTEVRSICEHYADLKESAGYSSVDSIIEKAAPKVFDFDFPIYDEKYRMVLEKKILRHYYTREIGDETVGLWKLRLETKMNEIMPYYNQLYKSTLYEFNPFYDVDYARSHQTKTDGSTTNNSNQDYNGTIDTTGTSHSEGSTTDNNTRDIDTTGTSKDTGTAHSSNKNSNIATNHSTTNGTDKNTTNTNGTSNTTSRYSDTPQGAISNLQNNTYLTNATIADGTTTGKETSNGSHSNTGDSTTNSNGTNESDSNTTENGETTGHSTNVFSDKGSSTDDGKTTGNQKSVNNTQYQATGTAKSMEEYVEHVSGKMNASSYSDLLIKFRQTFLNIDVMIINELKPLFFELW